MKKTLRELWLWNGKNIWTRQLGIRRYLACKRIDYVTRSWSSVHIMHVLKPISVCYSLATVDYNIYKRVMFSSIVPCYRLDTIWSYCTTKKKTMSWYVNWTTLIIPIMIVGMDKYYFWRHVLLSSEEKWYVIKSLTY